MKGTVSPSRTSGRAAAFCQPGWWGHMALGFFWHLQVVCVPVFSCHIPQRMPRFLGEGGMVEGMSQS